MHVQIRPLQPTSVFGPVSPHGLLGQTFDMDGIAVSGSRDSYTPTGAEREVTTSAMSEGAIEGGSADYKASAGPPAPARPPPPLNG